MCPRSAHFWPRSGPAAPPAAITRSSSSSSCRLGTARALDERSRVWEEPSATNCIVDGRTYLVIDVIPSQSQRADRADRAQLILSAEQTRFIFVNVAKDAATNVSVRLAFGAELLAFPEDVLRRLPEMERYRYIIASSDSAVAIVDPYDNAVVLVIDE